MIDFVLFRCYIEDDKKRGWILWLELILMVLKMWKFPLKFPCKKTPLETVGNHGSLYKSPPGIKR